MSLRKREKSGVKRRSARSKTTRYATGPEREMTYILGNPTGLKKTSKRVLQNLKYLFQDPEFQQRVRTIREQFRLPAYGIRSFLGVTDEATPDKIKANREKFENEMALTNDDRALRRFHIRRPSRAKQFQAEIARLSRDYDLPSRFNEGLSIYVRYGSWPIIYPHSSRVIATIREEAGTVRLSLEIFGDTKREDIKDAWPEIERLKKEYGIKGAQLFRATNYYLAKMLAEGRRPIDPTTLAEVPLEQLPFEQNILKHRYKRRKREAERNPDCDLPYARCRVRGKHTHP